MLKIKEIRERKGMTQDQIVTLTNIKKRTYVDYENEKSDIPFSKLQKIATSLEVSLSELVGEKSTRKTNTETKQTTIEQNTEHKVPFYDIDVTSHITTSFNDVVEEPSFYVDYQPFNDCTAYVSNYGDSMFPKYKNGERLAVKQITNFDVLAWGETYLVITNGNANDLKTVKDVHPHEDFDKIILRASNPSYKGDTPVNKEDIISMFAVKGKISQNFI